jgi:hypothetical protein
MAVKEEPVMQRLTTSTTKAFLSILALMWLTLIVATPVSLADDFGRFEGKVSVEWDGPRDMTLTQDFTYIDANGKKWVAPKGSTINGASIPRLFWTLVGSPYTGEYRYASVIHDYFCDQKSEPWRDVHRVFYYASRAAGTPENQAKLMYFAIYAKGPRWGADISNCASQCHSEVGPSTQAAQPSPTQRLEEAQRAADIASWIDKENPSLEEIETVSETFTHAGITRPLTDPPK